MTIAILKMPETIKTGSIDFYTIFHASQATFLLAMYQDEPILYGGITLIAAGVLNLDKSMTL